MENIGSYIRQSELFSGIGESALARVASRFKNINGKRAAFLFKGINAILQTCDGPFKTGKNGVMVGRKKHSVKADKRIHFGEKLDEPAAGFLQIEKRIEYRTNHGQIPGEARTTHLRVRDGEIELQIIPCTLQTFLDD